MNSFYLQSYDLHSFLKRYYKRKKKKTLKKRKKLIVILIKFIYNYLKKKTIKQLV